MKRQILVVALAVGSAVPAQSAQYSCFGDSNTQGPTGSNTDSYLGTLGAYLATREAVTMINNGLGGETTNEGVDRLNALLQRSPADFVLIMEGTNDVTRWVTHPPTWNPSTTEANLRQMVADVQSHGKTPILATILPRLRDNHDPDGSLTRQLNGTIRRIANDLGASLAEVHASVGPFVNDFTFEDALHPTKLGYDLVAEAFAAAITGEAIATIDLTAPVPVDVSPLPGSKNNSRNVTVRIGIAEQKHPVDPAAAVMTVDGGVVTPSIDAANPSEIHYSYSFPAPLAFGQQVSVAFTIADTSPAPHQLAVSYTFRVAPGNGTNGDIDSSGRIDGGDLAILAAAFGTRRGEPRYRIEADVDGNGDVDGEDLVFLASRFGEAP